MKIILMDVQEYGDYSEEVGRAIRCDNEHVLEVNYEEYELIKKYSGYYPTIIYSEDKEHLLKRCAEKKAKLADKAWRKAEGIRKAKETRERNKLEQIDA